MRWRVMVLLLLGGLALAQNSDAQAFALRLEQAWRLVKERYYDTSFKGLDWEAIGHAYRQRLGEVRDWEGLYRLLDEMYGELRDDHSRVLSPAEARHLLGGAQCLPLPFKDQDLLPSVAPPSPRPAQPAPPAPPPSQPSRTPPEAPQVRFINGVVVVRLSNLIDATSSSVLQNAIRQYEARARGYVLDLRGNPGGLALRMAEVAGIFMRGVPWRIVSRGLGGVPLPTTPFLGRPQTQKPLVVLIDGNVHSAAEGLAGALKNAGRAYLIGTRSAGNTEALTPYCFPDGGVALVAGGVLAPFSGPTWEGRGVEPDLVEENPDEQLEAALRYILRHR
ncbi:S41 family peptidase [Meiothermus taiwanensis]|jgi:carboxyl-terminal processing protease|uniref:Peptidase S41 n=1 Tax=Meiothermus taiwanensis WR-220 TaxID=1339250 RepID=A0ABM6WLA4_9DEIN|nr:S41 family peptidase [Meiothermus taiwanensis]AWR87737.1 peptidase S41 [Meiothermus taiwanensis WR-220]KIQ54591.1 peptidase S41 [Meiothermus taiwanensis]KZK15213.1 peptidase S41 [Meiothermus taiwanensis]